MTKKLLFTLTYLTVLTTGLFDVIPIEITDSELSRTISIILMIVVPLTIFFVFRTILKLDNRLYRNLLLGLTTVISFLYFYIGVFTIFLVTSRHYPIWTDTITRTNKSGDIIIEQTIELSGSLYDYRTIKVYKDFGNGIRLSRRCSDC